jgi:hypothetical protein
LLKTDDPSGQNIQVTIIVLRPYEQSPTSSGSDKLHRIPARFVCPKTFVQTRSIGVPSSITDERDFVDTGSAAEPSTMLKYEIKNAHGQQSVSGYSLYPLGLMQVKAK